MNAFKLSNYERLMINRKIKAKRRRRNAFIIILLMLIILLGITGYLLYKNDGKLYSKPLNAKTLVCPDYVDKQFIHTGLARTGVKLIEINNIVIHYTGNPASTAENNRDYFNKLDTDVCSHFVVGLDGEIIQCVPIDEKSSASNNRNLDTISIEVCHPDSNGKFNENTYDSLVKLTAWLCENSGLNSSDVIRHYDITGKECPKYYVKNQSAWDKLINDIDAQLKKQGD